MVFWWKLWFPWWIFIRDSLSHYNVDTASLKAALESHLSFLMAEFCIGVSASARYPQYIPNYLKQPVSKQQFAQMSRIADPDGGFDSRRSSNWFLIPTTHLSQSVYFKVRSVFKRICDLLHRMNYILDLYLKLLWKVWQHSRADGDLKNECLKHMPTALRLRNISISYYLAIFTWGRRRSPGLFIWSFSTSLLWVFSSFGSILTKEAAKSSFVNLGPRLVWWRAPFSSFTH